MDGGTTSIFKLPSDSLETICTKAEEVFHQLLSKPIPNVPLTDLASVVGHLHRDKDYLQTTTRASQGRRQHTQSNLRLSQALELRLKFNLSWKECALLGGVS
jgi:hypothetical protein